MKKIILLIICVMSIFITNISILADSIDHTIIKGRIIDAKTGEPLHAVNVVFENTSIGSATNVAGEYVIQNAPTGQLNLLAIMIGYKRGHKSVLVGKDQSITVNFSLDEAVLEMGAIVVTGTATPHIVQDSPVKTELIPRTIIEQKQAVNLAEALEFQTGIRVENNCSNCNFSQVRILGLDGKYSQILIDGDPVVSSLAGVYGLEHFPQEMVDQIEIVKGGGSSLYGGGAIAGVINMITKRPDQNKVRIKYLGNSISGKLEQNIGVVAERVNKSGTSGTYVFGSFRERTPYDHNGDGFSELGELKNEAIGFKWYYKLVENGELLASFHHLHEERRGGNKFEVPVHEADIAEWVEHWRSGGTIRWTHSPTPFFDYKMFYSFSQEKRKSYYGGLAGSTPADSLDALKYYGRTANPLQIGGMQFNYRYGRHLMTAGMQYTRDKLNDKTSASKVYHINTIYSNVGIFLQDNLHFGSQEEVELVLGVRFDKHSELSSWIISPRFNAKVSISKDFSLRGAYTTGFRPPQTFDEDLHIGGVSGDQRIIRNSPDLKEEKSYTISTGLEYQGWVGNAAIMASLTFFKTRIHDSFSQKFISKENRIENWQRINSDGAEAKGVELDLGLKPFNGVEIRGGITYKKGRFDSPHKDYHTRKFLRTPDLTANLRFNLNPSERLSLFLAGNYTGIAELPHEIIIADQNTPDLVLEKSGCFYQIDIGVMYKLPISTDLTTKISFGIKNILNSYQRNLDTGINRDPGFVYGPSKPRTIYCGLETTF